MPTFADDMAARRPDVPYQPVVPGKDQTVEHLIALASRHYRIFKVYRDQISPQTLADRPGLAPCGGRTTVKPGFIKRPSGRAFLLGQDRPAPITQALAVFQCAQFFDQRDADVAVRAKADPALCCCPDRAVEDAVAKG